MTGDTIDLDNVKNVMFCMFNSLWSACINVVYSWSTIIRIDLTLVACSCATAVGNTILPQCGGAVRYQFSLINGARDIPAGSKLTFSVGADSQTIISNSQCILKSNSAGVTVGSSIAGDSPQLAANAEMSCSVDAFILEQHAELGHIPAFDIVAKYENTNTNEAVFHIPPVSTVGNIPVHTGSKLQHMLTEVVTDDSATYFSGR